MSAGEGGKERVAEEKDGEADGHERTWTERDRRRRASAREQDPRARSQWERGRTLAERSLARRPKQQSTNALPQLLSVPFRAFTSDNPAQQSPARVIRTPRPRRYLSPATLFPSSLPAPAAPCPCRARMLPRPSGRPCVLHATSHSAVSARRCAASRARTAQGREGQGRGDHGVGDAVGAARREDVGEPRERVSGRENRPSSQDERRCPCPS